MGEVEDRKSEADVAIDLVARIGRGDRGAEEQLCERYYYRLLYFIKKRTGGDVELAKDICQQTFLQGLQKLRNGEIKNPASLASFLHGIAVHDIMNQARKRRRQATHADLDLLNQTAGSSSGPLDQVTDIEFRDQLMRAMRRLSLPDRNVLIRLFLREEERESVCASEGYNPKQFNNIVWRAKQRLKYLLLKDSNSRPKRSSRTG